MRVSVFIACRRHGNWAVGPGASRCLTQAGHAIICQVAVLDPGRQREPWWFFPLPEPLRFSGVPPPGISVASPPPSHEVGVSHPSVYNFPFSLSSSPTSTRPSVQRDQAGEEQKQFFSTYRNPLYPTSWLVGELSSIVLNHTIVIFSSYGLVSPKENPGIWSELSLNPKVVFLADLPPGRCTSQGRLELLLGRKSIIPKND